MAKKRGRPPIVPDGFKNRRDFERAVRKEAKATSAKAAAEKFGRSTAFVHKILKKDKV